VVVCHSLSYAPVQCRLAEHIKVLFAAEKLVDPVHIVLDGDKEDWLGEACAKLLMVSSLICIVDSKT